MRTESPRASLPQRFFKIHDASSQLSARHVPAGKRIHLMRCRNQPTHGNMETVADSSALMAFRVRLYARPNHRFPISHSPSALLRLALHPY